MKLHGEPEELIAERKITGGFPMEVTLRLRHHACGGLAVMRGEDAGRIQGFLRGSLWTKDCIQLIPVPQTFPQGPGWLQTSSPVTPSLGWVLELSWPLPGKARIPVHDMEAKFPLALERKSPISHECAFGLSLSFHL